LSAASSPLSLALPLPISPPPHSSDTLVTMCCVLHNHMLYFAVRPTSLLHPLPVSPHHPTLHLRSHLACAHTPPVFSCSGDPHSAEELAAEFCLTPRQWVWAHVTVCLEHALWKDLEQVRCGCACLRFWFTLAPSLLTTLTHPQLRHHGVKPPSVAPHSIVLNASYTSPTPLLTVSFVHLVIPLPVKRSRCCFRLACCHRREMQQDTRF